MGHPICSEAFEVLALSRSRGGVGAGVPVAGECAAAAGCTFAEIALRGGLRAAPGPAPRWLLLGEAPRAPHVNCAEGRSGLGAPRPLRAPLAGTQVSPCKMGRRKEL